MNTQPTNPIRGPLSRLGSAAGLALALCLSASGAHAQDQTGGAAGDWLSHYTSARTLGLGGAFVATANEPLGVVWNPAGLSLLYQNEVHFESARLHEQTSLYSFSFAMPSRTLPSIGITVLSLSSGDFERTSELNESLGSFSEGDVAFFFSASKNFTPKFALGANLKVISQSVEEFSATGVGADFGLLYDVTPSIRAGISVLNVGGPNLVLRDTQESYPGEVRGGLSTRLFGGKGLVTVELDQHPDRGMSFHGGGEYWLYPSVGVRAGLNNNQATGGLSYRFDNGMRVDYGMADQDLGVTHRIGLSYRFGGFFADSEADPTVFSPIGQHSVTKFGLKAKTKAEATDWSLEIVDKSSQVIRRFGGKGMPPAHVMWDGKSESGLPLPDGVYRYLLTVSDAEGRTIVGRERMVEISTTGPRGSVPVATN